MLQFETPLLLCENTSDRTRLIRERVFVKFRNQRYVLVFQQLLLQGTQ